MRVRVMKQLVMQPSERSMPIECLPGQIVEHWPDSDTRAIENGLVERLPDDEPPKAKAK